MAHHSKQDFPSIEQLGIKVGPTGKFPEGKLNPVDEGEIKIGITVTNDKVVIVFGKSVAWIGFTRGQARELGELLIKRSSE